MKLSEGYYIVKDNEGHVCVMHSVNNKEQIENDVEDILSDRFITRTDARVALKYAREAVNRAYNEIREEALNL